MGAVTVPRSTPPISYEWPSSHTDDPEKGTTLFAIHRQTPPSSGHNATSDLILPLSAHTKETLSPGWEEPISRVSSTSTLASNDAVAQQNAESFVCNAKQNQELVPRYRYHWMNVLRWEWLSTYRRLNLIVLLVNILVIVVFAAQHRLLGWNPGVMATALAANITTAVIFRQEYVVNALFIVFGRCPPSWPLWIKRLAAKIYHFGGVHSGAGMASIIWLALFDASVALSYKRTDIRGRDMAIIVITALLNLLLCGVVVSSLPRLREKYHNIWETTHRFGGWAAIALFWANFGLLADEERRRSRPSQSIVVMLFTSATFWMLFVVTICLVMPWLRLRKVPVHAEYQSKHAVRLHFTYTNLPLCAAPRLAMSPLRDWHSFAGIPEESGHGFSVLVSGVGDWTRSLVDNPPSSIWIRGIPVRGVLHIAPIFKKVVLVATGSGIGPVLSLLYARDIDCRILWCTREPSLTYQPNIVEQVRAADPQARIIARVRGQPDPDLGELALQMVRESGAEAVFVISNKEGCFKARIWLESRGVVVFTPIFDS